MGREPRITRTARMGGAAGKVGNAKEGAVHQAKAWISDLEFEIWDCAEETADYTDCGMGVAAGNPGNAKGGSRI